MFSNVTQPPTTSNSSSHLIKLITNRVLNLISEEITSVEVQNVIKQKIIHPLITMIYSELHPYIITLMVTIVIILLLSLMTFLCFVLYYFKKL